MQSILELLREAVNLGTAAQPDQIYAIAVEHLHEANKTIAGQREAYKKLEADHRSTYTMYEESVGSETKLKAKIEELNKDNEQKANQIQELINFCNATTARAKKIEDANLK